MEYILIQNGKKPDEPYNVRLFFWLPPDSPYGNIHLKLIKLCMRLDEANRRLQESYRFWHAIAKPGMISPNEYDRHVFATEEAIYMMRRSADELISIIWCLNEFEKRREYPKEIEVDSIGALLKSLKGKTLKDSKFLDIFKTHKEILQALNEISNAFKHSFVNSDITLIGRDEPCVHALALRYNKLESGAVFHNVPLRQIVTEYNSFYNEAMQWLKEFSKRNRG
jgi:hypothetical protein